MTIKDYIINYFADIFFEDMCEIEAKGDTTEIKDEYVRESLLLNLDTYADTLEWSDLVWECNDDVGETIVEIAHDLNGGSLFYEKVLTDEHYKKSCIIHHFFDDIYNHVIEHFGRPYEQEEEEDEE